MMSALCKTFGGGGDAPSVFVELKLIFEGAQIAK